ncbi:MAG: Panacea domain-containing protein [Methylocella sp.]
MAHDVRAIANWVLDCAEAESRSLSNLAINKVLFFLHASYLVHFGRPLVSAKIEAWEYGPVFREIYHAFKIFNDKPITSRATRINAGTGLREVCKLVLPAADAEFLRQAVAAYIHIAPSALVTLSHKPGGPWDKVWNHEGRVNSSMKISDELIQSWYDDSVRH